MNRRIGLCTACTTAGRSVPAKYRCPACQVPSCSLPCVRIHKATTKCTGVRNRAAPVRKAAYTDAHLISDYTLLEDAGRLLDAAARSRNVPAPRLSARPTPAPAPGISKGRMSMLSREAAKRNILLRFMPRGFARHARNSSHVRSIPEPESPLPPDQKPDPRDKAMFWHLDVYFASCSDKSPGTKLVKVDACEEEADIKSILLGATGALRKGRRRRSDLITCTSKANYGYAKYVGANPKDLVVFLRNEHVLSANNPASPPPASRASSRTDEFELNRYVPVDNGHSLRQVLNGRSVVEFPVFHVAFKDSKQAKELASASSGIFEKPDESDDSDSCSSSESESEDDDDQPPEPVEPTPPALEPKQAEQQIQEDSFAGRRPKGELEESSTQPPLKARRLESPPSIATCQTGPETPSTPVSKDLPLDLRQDGQRTSGAVVSVTRDTVMREGVNGLKEKEGIQQRPDVLEPRPTLCISSSNSTKRRLLPEELGSSESDSFATDLVGRRGGGMPMDHPYMKESVKAILETRIPRKRKEDKAVPCSTSSEKQSPSRPLSATRW